MNIESEAKIRAKTFLLENKISKITLETYSKYKAIREEHRRIWEIQSCVEKGCHAEQTHQKKDHRKQEER